MVQCFYKSGNPALTKASPCNVTAIAEGQHTSCCSDGELCMSNGLCRNATSTPKTNFYWRGGCTDPTFQDPACPNYCNLKSPWEDQLIWQCEGNEWCCNNGGAAPEDQRYDRTNLTCCTMSQFTFSAPSPSLIATAEFLGDVFTVASLASTSMPSSSGDLTTTTMASATSTSPAQSLASTTNEPAAETHASSSKSSTSPVAIGVGVGVGVAAAIIIVATGLWLWRSRRNRRRSQMQQSLAQDQPAEFPAVEHRTEAPVEKYRAELASSIAPQELAGDSPYPEAR